MVTYLLWEQKSQFKSDIPDNDRVKREAIVCKTMYRGASPRTVSMPLKHLMDDVLSCKQGKRDRYLPVALRKIAVIGIRAPC